METGIVYNVVTATKVYLVVPYDGFDAQRVTIKISFQYKRQLRGILPIHTFNDGHIDKACNGKKFSKSTDRMFSREPLRFSNQNTVLYKVQHRVSMYNMY